jgi:hypothetical protein
VSHDTIRAALAIHEEAGDEACVLLCRDVRALLTERDEACAIDVRRLTGDPVRDVIGAMERGNPEPETPTLKVSDFDSPQTALLRDILDGILEVRDLLEGVIDNNHALRVRSVS